MIFFHFTPQYYQTLSLISSDSAPNLCIIFSQKFSTLSALFYFAAFPVGSSPTVV